uniref:Uncharacterized protein n=1 Tax=Syphacia muris TaxID=451379 RepID=A0A0N5AU25_9BILA
MILKNEVLKIQVPRTSHELTPNDYVPIRTLNTQTLSNPLINIHQSYPLQTEANPSSYLKRFRSLQSSGGFRNNPTDVTKELQFKVEKSNLPKSLDNIKMANKLCSSNCSPKCETFPTLCQLFFSNQPLRALTAQTQKRTPQIVYPVLRTNTSSTKLLRPSSESTETFLDNVIADQKPQQLVETLNSTSSIQKYPMLILTKIADDLTKYLKLQALEFKKRDKSKKHKKTSNIKNNATEPLVANHTDAISATRYSRKWRQSGVKSARIGYLSRLLSSVYDPKSSHDEKRILLIPKKLDPNRSVFSSKNLPADYFIVKKAPQ